MNDRTFINALFMSLPQTAEWRSLRNSLYRKGTLLTLNEAMNELNAEYDRIVQDRAINDHGEKFAGVKGVETRRSQGKERGKDQSPTTSAVNVVEKDTGRTHWND